jgi:Tfp pilus assembly protein PilF
MSARQSLLSFPRRHPAWALGALLVLAGLGALAGPAWRYVTFRREHERAERALADYDFEEALEHLRVCVDLRPDDAPTRLLAAQAARRANRYPEAEEHLNAYSDLPGKSTAEGALERALLEAQRGRLEKVYEPLYEYQQTRHPRTEEILEALAVGLAETYQVRAAGSWLEKLLEQYPGNVPGRILRGQLSETVGNKDQALADYHRAVRDHPDNGRARLRLAEALVRYNEPAEAVEHFEWLRARRPDSVPALLGLAGSYARTGRHDRAREVLRDLLARHPDDGDALLEWGKLLSEEGELAEAERALRRAVAAQPFVKEAHYQLALCLRRRGKESEAREHLRRRDAIEADEKELERAYRESLKHDRDPRPRWRAGVICLRNGQEGEALRWFDGALQLDPNHKPTHEALANYYERKGDAERARRHRREAGLEFSPLTPR